MPAGRERQMFNPLQTSPAEQVLMQGASYPETFDLGVHKQCPNRPAVVIHGGKSNVNAAITRGQPGSGKAASMKG